MRERIEDYLDGTLDAAARRQVEATLASDPAAAALHQELKSARALRQAVYASYTPTPAEASALASSILAACHAEADTPAVAGRIGPRPLTRWLTGIAAGLVIALTAFTVGRSTAPVETRVIKETVAAAPEKVTEYQVVYLESGQDPEVLTFASKDQRDDYLRTAVQRGVNVEQRNGAFYAVASIEQPGKM